MPTNIRKLQKQAYATALKRGQYDKPEGMKALLLRVVNELSECADEIQKGKRMDEVYFEEQKPCGIPTELADAFIVIMSICEHHQIDLEKAVKLKMAYNETRKEG